VTGTASAENGEAMERLIDNVQRAYDRQILDEGKEAQAVILVTYVVTFLTVRFITHAIRAGKYRTVFRNVSGPGGTHLHHLVPGIILLLVSGFLGIGIDDRPWRLVVAVLFGIGAALTLDEFALWLHLEDVYWAKAGRQSIDAVMTVAALLLLAVVGGGFWIDNGRAIGRVFG
jgi:hypothetical protein